MASPLTPQMLEDAFQYWRNDGHYDRTLESVAIKFNRSSPAITEWAKKGNWKARRDKEIEERNELLKHEIAKSMKSDCEFVGSGIGAIFADYLRQILVGTRQISEGHMEKLLEIMIELERGKYANTSNNETSKKSKETQNTLDKLLGQIGQVLVDGRDK